MRFFVAPDLFGFFFGISAVSGFYDVERRGARRTLPDIGVALDLGGKIRAGRDFFSGR